MIQRKKKSNGKPAPRAATNALRGHKLASGEVLRGITLHKGQAHHLIELPGEFTGTHAEALDWAKKQGGELPSRIDGIVLFDGAKADYKSEWYWLAPQHADDSVFAWYQTFGYGYQYWTGVSYRFRARAVRRVPIQ